MATLPRPSSWDDSVLSPAVKLSLAARAVGNAVYEPGIPELQDEILDTLNPKLHELYKYCEVKNVLTVAGLEKAPSQIQQLLKDHQLRPEIMRYLHNRRALGRESGSEPVPVWADDDERKEMEVCHPRSIEILK